MQKPWIIGTGLTRGIGFHLSEKLRFEFNFLSVGRKPSHDHHIFWDLRKNMESSVSDEIQTFISNKNVFGVLYCAGELGMASSSKNAWLETMNVNCNSGVQLIKMALPYLQTSKFGPPFVCHLSSGAAIKPYVGWDAYCSSKAAMLMYFRALALTYSAHKLLCHSIAPGTVMTDMMQEVLNSDEKKFPEKQKFLTLQQKNLLANPIDIANTISKLLLEIDGPLQKHHGMMYDLRS